MTKLGSGSASGLIQNCKMVIQIYADGSEQYLKTPPNMKKDGVFPNKQIFLKGLLYVGPL